MGTKNAVFGAQLFTETIHSCVCLHETVYRTAISDCPEAPGLTKRFRFPQKLCFSSYDDDQLVAQKAVAINDHGWRVVRLDVTVNGAGEHVLTVGALSGTVTVE